MKEIQLDVRRRRIMLVMRLCFALGIVEIFFVEIFLSCTLIVRLLISNESPIMVMIVVMVMSVAALATFQLLKHLKLQRKEERS